jgi:hypothetical protein
VRLRSLMTRLDQLERALPLPPVPPDQLELCQRLHRVPTEQLRQAMDDHLARLHEEAARILGRVR